MPLEVEMDPDTIDHLSGRTAELSISDDLSGSSGESSNYSTQASTAPRLTTPGVTAEDITSRFRKAVKHLDLGQVIKDEFFTMFEAVGAVELMDPKMDTGYLAPGESADDDYDVTKDLLPEEALWIIDKLLCLEMAWHMGHPLSQTLFNSLYIDRIFEAKTERLDEMRFEVQGRSISEEPLVLQILRAYCVGLIKTCSHVNNCVKSEHYYEEEDFVSHTYDRYLLDGVDDDLVLEFLQDTIKLASEDESIEPQFSNPLVKRLQFRAQFLRTVKLAEERAIPDLANIWNELHGLLPGIQTAMELSKPIPESFSTKLQRKLGSTVPPRPVVDVAFDAAYKHLEQLCRDGQILTEVLDYHDSHSLMNFVSLFMARNPQPSVYIRMLLQHYILGDMIVLGKMSIRQLLDEDLASIVLPADQLLDRLNDEIEVPSDPRHIMAQRMELFRSRAAQTYVDILWTFCQNRCRVRRTLHHSICDWDNLQMDAEELDTEMREYTKEEAVVDPNVSSVPIYSYPLSSWAYFYKLRLMETIVQTGFELEVYHPDEFAGMYWYLQHIAMTRAQHLQRIRGFIHKKFAVFVHNNPNPTPQEADFQNADGYVSFQMLECTAKHGFADAVSCLYVVLDRLKLVPRQPRPYGEESIRHELRMKPFLGIILPDFIPYATFNQSVTQPNESATAIITYASEAIAKAKSDYELLQKLDAKRLRCQGKFTEEAWRADRKNEHRACIFAGIAIGLVKKVVEQLKRDTKTGREVEKDDYKIKVEIPKVADAYHMWWVVPKITRT